MKESIEASKPADGDFSPLSLRLNFSWTFAGNVVYYGCQWAMIMVLAKSTTPAVVGTYALGMAICMPIFMFANMQMSTAQATDIKHQYVFSEYLRIRVQMAVIAYLTVIGAVVALRYDSRQSIVILLIGLAKAFEALSDIFYGLFQQNERMDLIAKSKIVKGLLALAVMGVILYLTKSLAYSMAGIAAIWMLIFSTFDFWNGMKILKRLKTLPEYIERDKIARAEPSRFFLAKGRLRNLFILVLPIGLIQVINSYIQNIPRYFISSFCDESQLGIFAALAQLQVSGVPMINALASTAVPRLAKYYMNKNVKAFKKLLLRLIGIGAVMGVMGLIISLVAGRQILTLLYKPEYAEYNNVFIWLMILGLITYPGNFLGTSVTSMRNYNILVPISVVRLVIMVVLSYPLIKHYGMIGSVWASLMSVSFSVGAYSILTVVKLKQLKN